MFNSSLKNYLFNNYTKYSKRKIKYRVGKSMHSITNKLGVIRLFKVISIQFILFEPVFYIYLLNNFRTQVVYSFKNSNFYNPTFSIFYSS